MKILKFHFCRIPVKNGIADWDCAGAIDIPAMADALSYIRQHAEFPVKALPEFIKTKTPS